MLAAKFGDVNGYDVFLTSWRKRIEINVVILVARYPEPFDGDGESSDFCSDVT